MVNVRVFLICIICTCSWFVSFAREVVPFNDAWQFKKGPFPMDVMKTVALWEGKWEDVTLPHTWNAKDMQQKANAFYQGVAYYRKRYFFQFAWFGILRRNKCKGYFTAIVHYTASYHHIAKIGAFFLF